ncbi:uncharacterized protein BXZ73DRAFT_79499 [Epithele typhae]|uniref:uncharacterized protein n=1 Tax=Epithele typhae TaxID=378194 RepID=UPI0020085E19|nr:uncharacterized protein BXZ73DRAFT_79499 [Epithele typhae]KAH9923434.1 hypothetical protein BXZ73DRAFT_79499 [Epithele typhae]
MADTGCLTDIQGSGYSPGRGTVTMRDIMVEIFILQALPHPTPPPCKRSPLSPYSPMSNLIASITLPASIQCPLSLSIPPSTSTSTLVSGIPAFVPSSPISSDDSDLNSPLASPSAIHQEAPQIVLYDLGLAFYDQTSFFIQPDFAQIPDGLEPSCAQQAPAAGMVVRGPPQGVDMNISSFLSMDPSPPLLQIISPIPSPVNKRKRVAAVPTVVNMEISPAKRPRSAPGKPGIVSPARRSIFNRKWNLQAHIDGLHKKIRWNPCPAPGCSFTSARSHDVRRQFQSDHTDKGSTRRKAND